MIKFRTNKKIIKIKKQYILSIIILPLIFTSLLIPNLYFYLWTSKYPQYSEEEIEMMTWIDKNTPNDSIIVTEPVLGSMTNAYTLRPAIAAHYEDWYINKSYLRSLLIKFFVTNNTTESLIYLKLFVDYYKSKTSTIIIIINPRVSYWIINSKEKWQWAHLEKVVPFEGLYKFNNSPFKLIYNKNENIIYVISIKDIY